jgi:regulatory protein
MKITSIKQQLKNPERVSIFVDEGYSFSLSLDELIKHKLAKGQELSQGDEKKFKKISEDGKLRARSLEWLLNRPHSTREFKDYLYKKKADPELSESLIREFTKKGYLDDAKFASWFIELKARKNKSTRAIRSELFSKGISGEAADVALQAEAIDEEVALSELINKKSQLSRYKNDPLKLAKYLTSQGFSYDLVKKHLAKDQPEP